MNGPRPGVVPEQLSWVEANWLGSGIPEGEPSGSVSDRSGCRSSAN